MTPAASLSDVETRPIEVSDDHVIPDPLKTEYGDIWVVWCPAMGKTPLAPWQEDHMYPCQWAEGTADPRVSFEKAASVAMQSVAEIAARWPFPPDADPDTVKPAVLLPPGDFPLVFVDLDDVILHGEITTEAWNILQRLGGYGEVSRSFFESDAAMAGAHAWVRGSLPGGRKKIITDLDDAGQLELYTDQARMTGGTWRHLVGTPRHEIPKAQGVIDDLLDRYADLDDDRPPKRSATLAAETTGLRSSKRSRESNPYFQLETELVANTGPFAMYGDGGQGPHPAHGGTSSADEESTNFTVDGDVWHCFAHNDGGGALALIGTLEPGIDVECGETWRVYREPGTLLDACLAARDKYAAGALAGATPPYRALVGVAERFDLEMADSEEQILGRATHRFAVELFNELEYPG